MYLEIKGFASAICTK
ncbi:hypothetical protein RDI58_016152 [Solanum bulbocastanum]|uniref:Uncharacterized protein n=1 Tax=Solanum bulbocastanum TaxID=147425 RepID=A0AAN8TM78_SOLBU